MLKKKSTRRLSIDNLRSLFNLQEEALIPDFLEKIDKINEENELNLSLNFT